MKPSDAEMEERHKCSTRYKNAQKRAKIGEEIRSIRTAVNILIAREKELQSESDKLKPARQMGRRGGA